MSETPASLILAQLRASVLERLRELRRDEGVSVGNAVTYLQDGDEAYPMMLAAIASAERSVHLETYIFDPDSVGGRFLRALAAAARAGVSVRLVVDAVGSYRMSASDLEYVRRAGVRVHVFNPIRVAPFELLSRRNHRKLLVVDGRVAFVGGMNISADHVPPPMGRGWRDSLVCIEGPAVTHLDASFARINTKDNAEEAAVPATLATPAALDGRVRVLWNNWYARRYAIRDSYLRHIGRAERSITFAHSYFVPDGKMRRALKKALERGVKIRLLLPGLSDVPIVKRAMEAFYAKYLELGIEVREWPGAMMHMKVAVFDDAHFTIGSYNLDHRSLRKNLEVALWISQTPCIEKLMQNLAADWQASVAITQEKWVRRTWLARLREWVAFRLRKSF
ncbi:MAG: phosphatidylserine/phosphatidylglycerophosphate/cardiolipin synthase family protein [Deltaproteobacteria bacterium]|nr:phosphatidylserine/phosphatidylglycerophosphate/cardiolipin synthase family protein [Deltaproteobacteria bacterium]